MEYGGRKWKTIIEPFKIKMVEPLTLHTEAERRVFLRDVNFNLFGLRSETILIDLLTDSGTAALSSGQWSAMMKGDESYAGARSFYNFKQAVEELFPFKFIIPTHQGRAAERILFDILNAVHDGHCFIPSNTHFDTTRANIERVGYEAVDLVIEEGLQPELIYPFKGNMDVKKLDKFLEEKGKCVPLVMLTVTNNSMGGQPVSMANVRETKEVCKKYGLPLFIDACRFAENAFFIKSREPGFASKTVKDIVQEMFSYADGMTMSAKKDGLVNMGGWLALNDDALAEAAKTMLIVSEGFPTYGGLSGRDLDCIAEGLREVIDPSYLEYRIVSTQYLGNALDEMGVPIVKPVGGHAVFIDARKFLPHIPVLQYPGQSLAVALYELGGIRSCEIGTVMFGMHPDGTETPAPLDLVRLAIPRRVYTQSHIDYVIEVFAEIIKIKDTLPGYRIVKQSKCLRHFTCEFERVPPS